MSKTLVCDTLFKHITLWKHHILFFLMSFTSNNLLQPYAIFAITMVFISELENSSNGSGLA